MDFDEMMNAWKLQEEQPLYGVNRDLLHLVVQSEQAELRRTLHLEKWTTYVAGSVMAAGAGAVLWWFLHFRESGLGALAVAPWLQSSTSCRWSVAGRR